MNTILTELRKHYTPDLFAFANLCAAYIGADHHKKLRRDIVKFLIGEDRPVKRCTLMSTAEIIKATFEQPQLF